MVSKYLPTEIHQKCSDVTMPNLTHCNVHKTFSITALSDMLETNEYQYLMRLRPPFLADDHL